MFVLVSAWEKVHLPQGKLVSFRVEQVSKRRSSKVLGCVVSGCAKDPKGGSGRVSEDRRINQTMAFSECLGKSHRKI